MPAELIGKGKCPLCGSLKATVSLTKKKLACLTCAACSCQVFARSERSDEKLRSLIEGAAQPPKPAEPPAPAPKPEKKPAEKEPAAAPAKSRDDWDVYA